MLDEDDEDNDETVDKEPVDSPNVNELDKAKCEKEW